MNPKPLNRRIHTPEFKASVLAACRQPGASVAAVAMANGVNANVVRKWLAGHGMKRCGQPQPASPTPSTMAPVPFLSVHLPVTGSDQAQVATDAVANQSAIRLDLDLGPVQVKLNCPRGSAQTAASLLHALAEMVARA
jgi:transposase-like protein